MPSGKHPNRQKTGGNAKPETPRRNRILKTTLRKGRAPVVLVGALVVLVALDSYLLFSQSPVKPPSGVELESAPPMIKVTPEVYDFGTVSQAEGVVTGELTLENMGGSDLIITGLRTSCGCTQVSLISEGKMSLLFGMHSRPLQWRAEIAPGEKAQLKIFYNPNVHSQLRGPITRKIQISSNDPENATYEVTVQVVQVG
ncbi:MAG: DUF1573 domain-containing protein [Fidelibacterota bacterium]